ncbi:MAG: hypothetical protein B6U69_03495 [Thermofilum sp. ex4484_15]|nr:MAG: hypothetical protein B6U69_03495 [Thermofilum sp. ex4484_15]
MSVIKELVAKLEKELGFIKGNVAILMLSSLVISFVKSMPETYYSLYVLGLGATPLLLGLMDSLASLVYSPFQFLGGYIADSYGRRKVIIYMTFTLSFIYLAYALAPDWRAILIAVMASEIASLHRPALEAIIADSIPPEKRGMGYSLIMLIVNSIAVPSPIVAGLICSKLGLMKGMRLIYFSTALGFAVAALIRCKLKETIIVKAKRTGKKGIRVREVIGDMLEAFKALRYIPRVAMYLIIASIIINFAYSPLYLYFVVYAKEVLGMGELTWGMITCWNKLASIVSLIPLGKLTDMVKRKLVLSITGLLVPVCILLFIKGGNLGAAIGYSMLGVALAGVSVSYNSLRADLVPKEYRGKIMGLENLLTYIAMALGDVVGGYLYEKCSPTSPFLASTLAVTLGFLLIIVLVKEPVTRYK